MIRLIAVLLLFTFASEAGAEEKNGLSVNVSKRTLNRSDRRASAYYTQYDRTQGYKVTIKNTSLKPMPEGELRWTILVVKALSSGFAEKYTGVEKVKPLLAAESVEMLVGAVPIAGYRYDRDYKDDMEYEVVVTHAGKETLRMTSKPAFAALAKRATLIETQNGEDEAPDAAPRRARAGAVDPTRPAAAATPAAPPTFVRPVPPVAVAPVPAPFVPPSTPAPPAPPVSQTPPAPKPPTPAPATTPAPEAQPFDFFNLNKSKPATGGAAK